MRFRVPMLVMVCLATHAVGTSHAQAARQKAAEELVRALKVGELMQAGATTMIDAQVRQNPMLAPYRKVMLDWAQRYITADAALPEFAKIYAAAFTEAELRDLLAFYKTPLGQKLVTQQADLMRQGAAVGERLGQKHQAELTQMIQARAAELQKDSVGGR